MALWQCTACNGPPIEGGPYEKPWVGACPHCGRFADGKYAGDKTADKAGKSTFAAAAKRSGPEYVPVGVPGFDRVLGGGLVPGKVYLVGGFKGTGKTTLLSMVCDGAANVRGRSMYASSEEDDDSVIAVARRLGILNDRVDVLGSQTSVENVIEEAEKSRPFLTVFDSLQKYSSRLSSGSPGSLAQNKAVTAVIRSYCQRNKRCAIVVNQMSAGGELKGGTDAAHDVDAVFVLAYPREDDEDAPIEENIRVLACDGKNRMGPENVKAYWRMTEAGLLEEVPPRSKVIEIQRGRYRRSSGD